MAVDQYGHTFEYIGVNTLVYSGGDISPSVTGGFVNGVWTGNVTLTGTATDATIATVAESDPNWNGTSNTFDVNAGQ